MKATVTVQVEGVEVTYDFVTGQMVVMRGVDVLKDLDQPRIAILIERMANIPFFEFEAALESVLPKLGRLK